MLAASSVAQADKSDIAPGTRYVAMGSSFAAGPGVGESADTPRNRCTRSADNYAHQLARRRGLVLVDVSCGGATTAHILGAWNELPPQIDAVTSDTALVTVTIGGNDVGYAGGLIAGSCAPGSVNPICRGMAERATTASAAAPVQPDWQVLESNLTRIAREVHRRAPKARLVFVEYPTILPRGRLCAALPLNPAAERAARAKATRLAQITETVARRERAGAFRVAAVSEQHNACSRDPWVTGFDPPPGSQSFVPYHPNLAGMTAIAARLDTLLSRRER